VVEWSEWIGAFHPRPTGEGTGTFRAPVGSFPYDAATLSWAFGPVRLNRQPNPPLPARSRPQYRPASQALSGPASCDAAGAGADQQPPVPAKMPWFPHSPGFWPAGTAPAHQNSPPPACQNSVGPAIRLSARWG